jgi:hypothetical protein
VSLIGTVIVSSPLSNVNVIVSVPSVVASAATINDMLSVVPVTKFPVRLAAFKSALDTPVIVYATVVYCCFVCSKNVCWYSWSCTRIANCPICCSCYNSAAVYRMGIRI